MTNARHTPVPPRAVPRRTPGARGPAPLVLHHSTPTSTELAALPGVEPPIRLSAGHTGNPLDPAVAENPSLECPLTGRRRHLPCT